MYIYTIYFVPFSTNLFPNKKSRINFPSPFLQFLMDAHARRRRGRKSVVNLIKMDDYLLSARTSVKYHARVRQREEASGDRANLHMAETCGWKLSSTVISWVISFEGWSMYIYTYTEPCICWSVYKEEVRKDSQLVHLFALPAGYIARLDDWIQFLPTLLG